MPLVWCLCSRCWGCSPSNPGIIAPLCDQRTVSRHFNLVFDGQPIASIVPSYPRKWIKPLPIPLERMTVALLRQHLLEGAVISPSAEEDADMQGASFSS